MPVSQYGQIIHPATDGKRPPGNNYGLQQAYDIRDLTCKEALELGKIEVEGKDRMLRASAICSLVKAWESACDRIRIIRGRPLPGSLRPESKPKRKPKLTIQSDPPDEA